MRLFYKTIVSAIFMLAANSAQANSCAPILAELSDLLVKSGSKTVADELNKVGGKYEALGQFLVLYDKTGTALGIAPDHSYAGMNLWDLQSVNGIYMVREYYKLASSGKGGKLPGIDWADPASNKVIKLDGFTTPLLAGDHFIVCTQLAGS